MIINEKLGHNTMYEEGLKFYIKKEFDRTLSMFESALTSDPTINPSRIFIERCKNYNLNPILSV